MALIWFRLHGLSRNLRLVNAALKAIDLVKLAQPMRNPNPGLFGGIPGSDPIHGSYIEGAVPNWAAKYFIDALLEKQRVLSELRTEPTKACRHCRNRKRPDCAGICISSGPSAQYYDAHDRPLAKSPADAERMARARHRQPDRGRRASGGRTGSGQAAPPLTE